MENSSEKDLLIQQVEELIFKNRKIEAIKVLRTAKGIDLKAAKEEVEQLAKELKEKFPDKFYQKSGCLTLLAVVPLVYILIYSI